jgi:hypothetical protein
MLWPLMVVSWVAFPLLVLAVSFGCGLLVERAGGWRMHGVIVAGVGLAVVVVLAELVTESETLAPATPWVVLGVAALGYLTSIPRLRELRFDGWTFALGLGLMVCFAAPIVLSGHNTFSAYLVLGDPTFHFLVTQELLAHGHRAISALPNQYAANIQEMQGYLTTGYPFGADLAAGALRPFVGTALPWVYSPFIAVVLTFGGLTLAELLRGLVSSRPLRALCALIAAQAGLAYGFYLVSSIKELATTWAVSLLVVLVVEVLQRRPSVRALAPLVVVAAAEIDILAVPAAAWIGLPLLAFAVASVWRVRASLRRPRLRPVAGTALTIVAGVAIAWPILGQAAASYSITSNVLSGSSAASSLGELLGPLNLWQILGIWPTGDFRLPLAVHLTLVHALLILAAVSAVGGALWSWRRRAWGPLLLLLGNGIAALVLLQRATPYAASKVEAILSITALLAAMLGAVALHDLVHPAAGWVLAALIALGVLWTNDKAWQTAPLAPMQRFAQLSEINQRFAGRPGPTFYNLWDAEYPAYFLRDTGVIVPEIYFNPPIVPGVRPRSSNGMQQPWDPNELPFRWLDGNKMLVMDRSPVTSRPPADFRLVMQTPDYDVYRRSSTPHLLDHVAAQSTPLLHVTPPSCTRIRALGARARAQHARLAYAPRLPVASVQAVHSLHPRTWLAYSPSDTPALGALKLSPYGGTLTAKLRVPRTGTYTVWLQGSISQKISVAIGGQQAGSVSGRIGPGGMWTIVARRVHLSAGEQPVIMNRDSSTHFSQGSPNDILGSLVLTRTAQPAPVRTVAPSRAASLCGTPMQWLEIVR